MARVEIASSKLMRDVTITFAVTGMRRTRLRMWLGALVVRLGAAIIGCRAAFELEQDVPVQANGVPRALSIDPAYRGFRPDWADYGPNLIIRLDGVEQKQVVAYDIDAGAIVRFPEQQPVPGSAYWPTERVSGVVTVEPRQA